MITAREVSFSLFGAWRLAHLDRSGMQYFDTSITGFWRSFWAAAIVAPAYLILVWLRLADKMVSGGPLRLALIEAIAYVIGWTAFPVAAWYLTQALGRLERYPGYIVAYNWANVLQIGAYLPVVLLGAGDILPDQIAVLLGVIVTIAVLFYQYFIARTALEIDMTPAIGIVVLDLLIGIFLNGVVDMLETRGG